MSLALLAEIVSLTKEASTSVTQHTKPSSKVHMNFGPTQVTTHAVRDAGSPFESPKSDSAISIQPETISVGAMGRSEITSLNAGSPFESPQSLSSMSGKEESAGKLVIEKSRIVIKQNGSKECWKTVDGAKQNHSGQQGTKSVSGIEAIPSQGTSGSLCNLNEADLDAVNINSSNSQSVAVSKKFLRDSISPQDECSGQKSWSIHGKSDISSKTSEKQKQRSFSSKQEIKAKIIVENHQLKHQSVKDINNKSLVTEREDDFSDGQPEIIDVLGKDSNVSQSSDESMSTENGVWSKRCTTGARGHVLFEKSENCHTLKQGLLNKGLNDQTRSSLCTDVYISQFGLTEKQRLLKEALARRPDKNQPKKHLVKPTLIQRPNDSGEYVDKLVPPHQQPKVQAGLMAAHNVQPVSATLDPAITAAAAASAAVAAAQPFLKTQHELETKIQQLLSHLSQLQQGPGHSAPGGSSSGSRVPDLERQVAELNERRLEHLENLQQHQLNERRLENLEDLQRQQLQMQAQLLHISQARNKLPTGREPSTFHQSQIPQAVSRRPYISSLRSDGVSHNLATTNQSNYNHSSQAIKPRVPNQASLKPAVLSKHQDYLKEVRQLQGSHLDTPTPRDHVPTPTPYTLPEQSQTNLGFLEQILSHNESIGKDSTMKTTTEVMSPARLDTDRNNSSRGRLREDQGPVDKARKLISSLSNLQKETADSVWGARENLTHKDQEVTHPAPLEQYLKYPAQEGSPYPKLRHHSKDKKRMLEKLDNLLEAKKVLNQLELTRQTLDTNIEQVVRSRRNMQVFSTLMGAQAEGSTENQTRIQQMVSKKIVALEGSIQREVLKSLAQADAEKRSIQQDLDTAARLRLEPSRNNLVKGAADRTARMAYSKPSALARPAATLSGKENRESKVKPPPKPTVIRDETTRARTYGKPDYQRGRTTLRDPYLHFQNDKKGVTAKTSVTNLNESARSRDGRSRSPPAQASQRQTAADPMPRQYYFSPTRGYIPLGGGDSAPMAGHLVPMAVPLGAPRLEPGVRRSATAIIRTADIPVSSTPVTAARNVTMVSYPVEGGGQQERQPELTKQVLPPIDIDSISPSSSQRSDIQLQSPQQANTNLTFLYGNRHIEDEEEIDLDKTLTNSSLDLEQSGEGINLPGYEPKLAEYCGTTFPPQVHQSARLVGDNLTIRLPVSDVTADNLRRRDLLERNAVLWLEQEVMARILSQLPQLRSEPEAEVSESETSELDQSLLVADVIGQGGMQLFIDAGQPVDNTLVQELVKEVIKEKVAAMLSQQDQQDKTDQRQVKTEQQMTEGGRAREAASGDVHRETTSPAMVSTPEPTPVNSPLSSPPITRKQHQFQPQPATPPQSPSPKGFRFKPIEPEPKVMQPEPVLQRSETSGQPQLLVMTAESETDSSVSLDISEELRRVAAGKGQNLEEAENAEVTAQHLATPPRSPPADMTETKVDQFLKRPTTPTTTPPLVLTTDPGAALLSSGHVSDEEEEDMIPPPIMVSVGVGEDRPVAATPQLQDKPPQLALVSPRSTSSEASSSSETSQSDTVNEFISEGQWLMSRSQGEVVVGLNLEALRRQFLTRLPDQHVADVSTASTWRDTDDLELEAECTQSEGEFLGGGLPDPDKDPRLEVLAQIHKRLTGVIPQGGRGPGLVAVSSLSLGEMSLGQVPVAWRTGQDAGHRVLERGRKNSFSPTKMKSSGSQQQNIRQHEMVPTSYSQTPSPVGDYSSRASTPPYELFSRASPPPPLEKQRTDLPGKTVAPSGQTVAASAQIVERSGQTVAPLDKTPAPQQLHGKGQGARPKAQMQYQPVSSEGRPLTARSRGQTGRRHSDGRMSQSSDAALKSSLNSESLSRSMDGQLLHKSGNGFLTSSLRSRNSGGIKKSVEFDLSGTQLTSNQLGSKDLSNLLGSRELSESLPEADMSAGLTYTQDSLERAELHRSATDARTGLYRMSVTIPSVNSDREDTDLSELDLSNTSDQ